MYILSELNELLHNILIMKKENYKQVTLHFKH